MQKWNSLLGASDSPAPPHSATEAQALVAAVYQLAFRRAPDPEGQASYVGRLVSGSLSCAHFIAEILASEEFTTARGHQNFWTSDHANRYLSDSVRQLNGRLNIDTACLSTQYENAWKSIFIDSASSLIIGQQEYGLQHKRRFYELIHGIEVLSQSFAIESLLEVGPSEFTRLYRYYFPKINVSTLDRPVHDGYIGLTPQVCLERLGSRQHFSVDLSKPPKEADAFWQGAQHDLVLLCEVLEHLTVHPKDLLAFMKAGLRPGGLLYLTTPNFLRQENIEKIRRAENPQALYPAGEDNWDAHHHYREYLMGELLDLVHDSGLTILAFYFSDCWDDIKSHRRPDDALGNLVLVAQKP